MVKTPSSRILKTGHLSPQFTLIGVDGKTYSMRDSQSTTLLIVFICNHCPYVKARIGDLIELQSHFDPLELQVLAINSNDPNYDGEGFDNMKRFAIENNFNFPYLFDKTQDIARSFGAVCTPDPFLFDKDRRLVYHGKINDALEPGMTPTERTIEENIKKVIRGEKIEKDFDPSVGCSIKWIENNN
jgi:peroxiredoxin